jgi:hypothetical protein
MIFIKISNKKSNQTFKKKGKSIKEAAQEETIPRTAEKSISFIFFFFSPSTSSILFCANDFAYVVILGIFICVGLSVLLYMLYSQHKLMYIPPLRVDIFNPGNNQ